MPWPRPIRSSTIASPTIWAARRPTSTCATAAYRHGIRLASDMVPNHMGIDSPWVIEHPEWFISRWDSPYPAYSFNGPDLSHDGRVEIKIEDHYYEQSDAAVVFRRRDKSTGETRYIYHGNDGTSFPWNDTAQLDYLNPAVREQVIQTILHVARLFPVIRFDAAMTLAKRHFHRLWFPGPGIERRHSFARRIRHEPGRIRPRHAARVLARSGRSRRRRSSRHAAAGRGLLAHGRLLRPHARHASRLQQRLHDHAARRGQRQVPLGHQEHPRVRSRHHEALRQLHEQSRRAHRNRPVRQGRQVLRRRRR